jgi:hypothetical protein
LALRVVGAGVGRTGTTSLQLALQQLLGGPCYHMMEVFPRPGHIEAWHEAAKGNPPEWHWLLGGFAAAVDWPASGFWRELSVAYPAAVVLLSVRESPEAWWKSASRTILHVAERPTPPAPGMERWLAMYLDLLAVRFTDRRQEPEAAMAAYVRHNDAVRAEVPAERLVEWQPGDGWEPIMHRSRAASPHRSLPPPQHHRRVPGPGRLGQHRDCSGLTGAIVLRTEPAARDRRAATFDLARAKDRF